MEAVVWDVAGMILELEVIATHTLFLIWYPEGQLMLGVELVWIPFVFPEKTVLVWKFRLLSTWFPLLKEFVFVFEVELRQVVPFQVQPNTQSGDPVDGKHIWQLK